jgi:hypothetical protein
MDSNLLLLTGDWLYPLGAFALFSCQYETLLDSGHFETNQLAWFFGAYSILSRWVCEYLLWLQTVLPLNIA